MHIGDKVGSLDAIYDSLGRTRVILVDFAVNRRDDHTILENTDSKDVHQE